MFFKKASFYNLSEHFCWQKGTKRGILRIKTDILYNPFLHNMYCSLADLYEISLLTNDALFDFCYFAIFSYMFSL